MNNRVCFANIGTFANIGAFVNIGTFANIGTFPSIGAFANIGTFSNICKHWHICKHWLTVRNFFTLVCSLLTVFLLTQEVYNFAITRPTSTAKEEEQLKASDIPDVAVCPDPGFDSSAFEKHGYMHLDTYYRGSMDGEKFVGWNGNRKKSSQEILEEVLSAGRNFQSLLSSASFR